MRDQDSVAVSGDGAEQGSTGVVLIVKLDLAIVFDPGGAEVLAFLLAWLFGWPIVYCFGRGLSRLCLGPSAALC